MKVRSSLKSLVAQPGSKVVRRKGRIYVINKQNPRFKGRPEGLIGAFAGSRFDRLLDCGLRMDGPVKN